ncbi:MAG: hypothetical protein K2Q01_03545 [Rickettsiales bacterium]|nr:hypothetical protein [Rickettsiales bacterium]
MTYLHTTEQLVRRFMQIHREDCQKVGLAVITLAQDFRVDASAVLKGEYEGMANGIMHRITKEGHDDWMELKGKAYRYFVGMPDIAQQAIMRMEAETLGLSEKFLNAGKTKERRSLVKEAVNSRT